MSEVSDPRASLARFPGFTQHFWTWFTGKALPGQKPLFVLNHWGYFAITGALFLGGLALSAYALVGQAQTSWMVLVLGWVLTLNSARTLAETVLHQCVHHRFTGRPKRDRLIGEILTTVMFTQDATTYRTDHFGTHHRRATFATESDPNVAYLLRFGFRPGMTRRQLWQNTFKTMVSPVFHAKLFWARIKFNALAPLWWRRGLTIAYCSLWAWIVWFFPEGWKLLLLGFAVPMIIPYQISALLENLGEHAWLTPESADDGSRYYHASRTWARFCDSPAPDPALPWPQRYLAWLRWIIVMLCYHLPARVFVVVGDLPNHDFHHRFPATSK